MDIPAVGDFIECPQCGSEDEATYTEVDGIIYIECSACGYFEEADFNELSDEYVDETYINSTAKKEKISDDDEHWIYYNSFLKNK